ncbi:biogenesis of lysosome-related organelles complex 1 subunit 1 [Hyalella azteca]|uniref:Biogenesis of lysosome-related organelles complex 1 subunit 1 n=1 Tax=Hyalella azteca TaxID=294128 RepID=A0A979FW59_HYAAZ|nr:biogenesis of lysosome-related organelles complex 1 subunit 1 [Hyalella azteca]
MERRRKDALQASTNLTNALVDHLNVGVAQAYLNQKRLDGEARRLEQSAAVLQKQTQHWITLVNGFCSALKQVGDVASWTQVIHKDVELVAATLHHAYTTTYTSTHSTPPPPTRAINAAGLMPAQASTSSGSGIALASGVTVPASTNVEAKNKCVQKLSKSPSEQKADKNNDELEGASSLGPDLHSCTETNVSEAAPEGDHAKQEAS